MIKSWLRGDGVGADEASDGNFLDPFCIVPCSCMVVVSDISLRELIHSSSASLVDYTCTLQLQRLVYFKESCRIMTMLAMMRDGDVGLWRTRLVVDHPKRHQEAS